MRFLVEAAALKRAMALIHPVIPRRHTIVIYESVLLRLSGDRLSIHAHDMPHAAILTLDVQGSEDGEALVSGARLKAIADAAPDGAEISFSCGDVGDGASVMLGRSRFRLALLLPADFPTFNVVNGTAFDIEPSDLERLLSCVACASRDETRLYLNGVFLHRRGESLCCAATDGHRLARVGIPLPEGGGELEDEPDQSAGAIIPTASHSATMPSRLNAK
jgi:DNA polymerase-3 subunit beta